MSQLTTTVDHEQRAKDELIASSMDFETLRWMASIAAVVAAVLVAARLSPKVTGWGFVIFTLSSCLWIAIALGQDKGALAFQNAVLTAINGYGIYRWLIKAS